MGTKAESATTPTGGALALFERWLDLPPAERSSELARIEATDIRMFAQLMGLIEADAEAQAGGFLAGDAIGDAMTVDSGDSDEAADVPRQPQIGPWTLEKAIGAGGMGRVWQARRHDGLFEGVVAIKMLHETSPDEFAHERFAREGQILARLAHPNIARLLDAGTLNNGQRYLVLEYVDGTRIDHYCDTHRLDVPARIRLFLQVCAAVAHAHTNLVVHRDIKPSNVLVMEGAQVKLLDFGVAKLIESEAAAGEESPLTRLAGAGLTPEYAAPEQIDGGPITTGTDVYSLGMVLYRLLSGRRPYGNETSNAARLAREIVDSEARPLSTCILDRGADAAVQERAAQRGTTPERLRRQLRGDLDNILAKTLRKAPNERYASVRELMDDLECHLANKPVAARPDGVGYLLGKFVRRHWLGVGAGAAVACTVIAAAAGMVWQGRIALEQEAEARRQALLAKAESAKATAVKNFMLDLFRANSPAAADVEKARHMTARELLDSGSHRVNTEFAHEPQLRQEVLDIVGELYYGLGEYDRAADLARQRVAVLEESEGTRSDATRDAYRNLGYVLQASGDTAELGQVVDRVQSSIESDRGASRDDRAWMLTSQARAALPGEPERALDLTEAALRELDGDDHLTAHAGPRRLAWSARADAFGLREDPGAAVAAARAAFDITKRASSSDALVTAISLGVLGQFERSAEELRLAERDLAQSLAVVVRRLGKTNEQALLFQAQLGAVKCRRGDYAEGAAFLRDAVKHMSGSKGANGPEHLAMRLDLAQAQHDAGEFGEAETLVEAAMPGLRQRADFRLLLARGLVLRSRLSTVRGDFDAARLAAEEAVLLLVGTDGRRLPSAIQAHAAAASAMVAEGRLAEARSTVAAMRAISEASGLRIPINQITRELVEAEVRLWRGERHGGLRGFTTVVDRLDLDDERDYHAGSLARALLGRGRAQLVSGKTQAACLSLDRAVELRSRQGPEGSPWLAEARVALADCLLAQGDREKAARLVNQAEVAYSRHAPLGPQFLYSLDKVKQRL